MRDASIGRLAQEWASTFDDHEKARQQLGEAHRRKNAVEEQLENARKQLIKAVRSNASATAKEQPIVIRTWKDHAVIVELREAEEAGSVRVALSVDRE